MQFSNFFKKKLRNIDLRQNEFLLVLLRKKISNGNKWPTIFNVTLLYDMEYQSILLEARKLKVINTYHWYLKLLIVVHQNVFSYSNF